MVVVVALAAGISGMLLKLNARWKPTGQILRDARENVVGATALALLAFAAVSVTAFVVWELR